MKWFLAVVLTLCMLIFGSRTVSGQRLQVSENNRFLVTSDGKPFFWLADTAWELFHRCSREEVVMYLEKRAQQGFTVIQAVALAEIDGLHTPNPYGEVPLVNLDPSNPNERYFEHVDWVLQKAEDLGLYVALLPTWGDKLFRNSWGVGPEILNEQNAYQYGKWIGNRYSARENIIWIIGGDRNPREGSTDIAVWNAMANGVADGAGGHDNALMSFHPQPTRAGGSSTWFHNEEWLDFNMHQTGHCANRGTFKLIEKDYQLTPTKPVLDGEPLYEDHPNCFNAKELGHSIDRDIRRIMYWNVFAGGFGQSYGCHAVWQMYQLDKDPINQPLRPWPEALDLPMANQAKHLKNLMLSRPFLTRIPDQSIVLEKQDEDDTYVIATRDQERTYVMVYFPTGKTIQLDFSIFANTGIVSWWFDPRTGICFKGPDLVGSSTSITPPSSGLGNDWVLVVDRQEAAFDPPGQ